jgi:serine/threonine protein kinase
MAIQIASGISRIHDLGFIHKDIRPHNILVDDKYVVKIGDMGIDKVFDESQTKHSLTGCLPYIQPEFYTGRYNKKLDVFTFGLTLVELFNGVHKKSEEDMTAIIIEKEPDIFWNLIRECVNKNPENRPTSKQIENSLICLESLIMRLILAKY